MNKLILTALVSLLIGVGLTYVAIRPVNQKVPQASQSLADNPVMSMPVINAYYGGREIWFMHTEVSDKDMAERLTAMVSMMNTMMGMPGTMHAQRLGSVSAAVAGQLYVFTNGVRQEGVKPWGGGPFGFQIDVFDSIPADDNYTPLRNVYLITWNENATPRILKSIEEILTAQTNGELTVKQTDAIVNAPIVKF